MSTQAIPGGDFNPIPSDLKVALSTIVLSKIGQIKKNDAGVTEAANTNSALRKTEPSSHRSVLSSVTESPLEKGGGKDR